MKVAIIHDFLIEKGGAEKVLEDLFEIYPKADLYTLFYNQKKLGEQFDKYKPQTSFLQSFPKFMKGAYLRPLSPTAVEKFDLSGYDLIISNCNSFAKGVLTPPDSIHISYIHSPTRYLWDYFHKYLKEHRMAGFWGGGMRVLFSYLRVWDKLASKRVDHFFANSKNVQKRIKKFYRKDSQVVYPGTRVGEYQSQKKGNYFLIVSRLSKYKKVDLAIKAFNKLNERLLVIGDGPQRKSLEKLAGGNIEIMGYKSDEVVKNYYSRARGFIFPQEEDFGLTPIEAMASGVPVIAYKKGGALETIEEGETGLFFKKQSPDSLAEKVKEFKGKEEQFNRGKIQNQAKNFSLETFKKDFKTKVDKIIKDEREKEKRRKEER